MSDLLPFSDLPEPEPPPRAVNPVPQQETAMVAGEDDEIPF